MKNDTIIIGTRSSKLALWQAKYIQKRLEEQYPNLHVELKHVTTQGDKILDAPLAKIGGKGLFTKELEEEMLAGDIDIAVHSLKDVPTEVARGLMITAVTKRADSGDAFVSNRYAHFADLPKGAVVGTSSLRRKAQLLHVRPDLTIKNLRGNVNTRLEKLDAGEYDAIVLAVAGLERLGFGDRIAEVLPQSMMLPAVGQGVLAIEAREKDEDVRQLVAFLNDEATANCVRAERSFLARVEGGCQVPIGVYAKAGDADIIELEALIASVDGKEIYRAKRQGSKQEAEDIGWRLADELLDAGGLKIMRSLGLLLDR